MSWRAANLVWVIALLLASTALARDGGGLAAAASASAVHRPDVDAAGSKDVHPASAGAAAGLEAATGVATSQPAAVSAPIAHAPSPQEVLAVRLEALLAGRLDPALDPRALFAVDLTQLPAVRQRAVELARLLEESQLAQQDLARQLATLRDTPVQVPEPAGLAQPPAPLALPELGPPPAPPEPPAARRPTRMTARVRAAWDAHDRALAAHAQALAAHQAAVAQQEATRAAHAQDLARHQALLRAHAQALAEARTQRAARLDELARRQAEAGLRVRTLELRLRYLQALSARIEQIGAAAQRGFVALGEPRTAMHTEIARAAGVGAAVRRLGERLAILDARARGGALVGFLVDRERFLELSTLAREQLANAVAACDALVEALGAAEREMAQEGLALQTRILHAVASPEPSPELDQAFLDHMREMRRQRRNLVARAGEDGSGADLRALVVRLEQLIPLPAAVPSFAEAEQALAPLGERHVEIMTLGEGRDVAVGRWRLAFERQVVATLEPLVSEAARREAYALSVALLGELQDEALDLGTQLARWGRGRLGDGWALVRFAEPAASWGWLARLALLIVVVAATLWSRRAVPGGVGWLVKQVARLRALRGRMGTVVRWAGLLQALAPLLLWLIAGEVLLRILGTRHTEVQILALLWHWLILFLLGRQALFGLTRRISRGRPALIDVREGTVALLRLTYDRLILMLVVTAVADDLVDGWLGSGQLRTLIDLVIVAGLSVWLVWACLSWRALLAARWGQVLGDGHRLQPLVAWMARDWRGAVLSPAAVLWLLGRALAGLVMRLSERGGLSTFLRARELKRKARKATVEGDVLLPRSYLDEFPLYPILGEQGAAVLGRDHVLAPILEQFARWRETTTEGSLVLVGEKGIGKSTLCGMIDKKIDDVEVVFHTLHAKVLDDAALASSLGPALGLDGASSVEDLTHHLQAGGERVIIIDDAHNLFLRIVDGYRGFDAMVQLVNHTSERVFWILVFNRYAWLFVNQSRRREHYFRRIVEMPRWSAAELQELISARNRRSGYSIRFSELLLDDETGPDDQFQLVEGAEGFFRLLWESSRGNPRIATHLWLSALREVDEKVLEVGLFRGADPGAFDNLGDDLWFALAAICQHENLSADELHRTLNVPLDFATFATRILREYGFVEAKRTGHERVTLSPRYFRQVLERLRAKHLLFEA